jgi:hypothetical protein
MKLLRLTRLNALLVLCMLAVLARAQQAPSSDAALLPQAPSQSKAETQAQDEKAIEREEQSERTLGVIPRFGTTDRMDAPPLQPGGKFKLFARTSFDPAIIAIATVQAGVSQADNQFAGYGQGAEGYGKRFGAAFADQVSAGFFGNFLYPTLFKQDPRYFRLGHGAFLRRFGYSLVQEFVCHNDRGGRAFNLSSVLGVFTAGSVSNVYYPSEDRGFKLTMSRSGLALGYASAGTQLSEFWPDIKRKVFKKK